MRFLSLVAMTASTVAVALSDPVSEYNALRHSLIKSEESLALGASLESTFTNDERVADRVIRAAKARALSPLQPDGGPPIASQHFFDAKPRMESTGLFPMLRSMPKGAVLHTHPDALQDAAWVVQHATYDSRLWVCGDIGTGQLDNPLQFQFSASPSGPSVPWNSYVAAQTVNCTWRNVVVLRNESGDARAFDQSLLEDLTLLTSRRPAYSSQKDVWTKFQNCFGRVSGIYYFDGFHQALMEAAFRAMRDDGVQHLELRQMLSPGGIYSLNGTVQPIDATLESLVAAAASTGITLRVQLAEMRAAEPALVATGIQETARLMAKYPELVVGFDLVGQEDAGRPLSDFLPELLQQNGSAFTRTSDASSSSSSSSSSFSSSSSPSSSSSSSSSSSPSFPSSSSPSSSSSSSSSGSVSAASEVATTSVVVPYFFHAGETDEAGLAPDLNLFDAVLLNSTRIGHGYSLSRHPELRQLVAQKGIAIEVCPLSNQLLMLVNDLRDHPAPSQWAADGNIPITINPDDPALWGAVAVTYDWFQFFLSTGNSTGLGLLKQLALNSWEHCSLSRAEAASGQAAWEEHWAAWVAELALTQEAK